MGEEGRNNIVWKGYQGHNFVPLRDANPDADEGKRFKTVGGTGRDKLCALYSPDGVNWRMAQEQPLEVSGAFDSANLAFWDRTLRKYRLFSRDFVKLGEKRYRIIQSCESDDFIHWSEPVPHRYGAGGPLEEFYTNATTHRPGAVDLIAHRLERLLAGDRHQFGRAILPFDDSREGRLDQLVADIGAALLGERGEDDKYDASCTTSDVRRDVKQRWPRRRWGYHGAASDGAPHVRIQIIVAPHPDT